MSKKISGIGASPGYALGNILVYKEVNLEFDSYTVSEDQVEEEKERVQRALQVSSGQLAEIKEHVLETIGEAEAQVFQAHMMILEDPEFIKKINSKIEKEKKSAPEAVDETAREYADIFSAMDNEYMRERAADILDVRRRIIANILGVKLNPLENIEDEVIIVARDLTPSDTALLDKEKVLGFVTEIGGRTSHTAIMARSLEIPAVVGTGEIVNLVTDGERIIVDGEDGEVIIRPEEEEWNLYLSKQKEYGQYMEKLMELKELPAETTDGYRVELAANIGSPADLEGALKYGAEGVGLFRTEFLYMDRSEAPSEEEQFEAYKEVAEAFGDKPVVIRTLDIGGDKNLPYLDFPKELNPFLGWRAIRFCLDRKDIFKTQLRAILRASHYGNVKIMYPLISGLEDLRAANEVLAEVMDELRNEGFPFNEDLEVGMMMEVPSAAVIADKLAEEADFFSIGTNDLIQYTLACDRINENVSRYYQPFHPAILRLIKMIVDGARKQGIWVGMCGEMAGDPEATELLLGLGLDELSMSATSILKVKEKVRQASLEECRKLAEEKIK